MPPSRSEPCRKRTHSDSDHSDRSGLRNGSPYIQAPPPSHSSSPQKHQYCLRSVRPERLQPRSRTVKAGHKDSPGHLTYLRRGPPEWRSSAQESSPLCWRTSRSHQAHSFQSRSVPSGSLRYLPDNTVHGCSSRTKPLPN